jgi:hypothetical protein
MRFAARWDFHGMDGIGMDLIGIEDGLNPSIWSEKGFHRKNAHGLESSKILMKFLESNNEAPER